MHFPADKNRPSLVYETADAAEIMGTGHLRIFRRKETGADEPLGAVAPGWDYYKITKSA